MKKLLHNKISRINILVLTAVLFLTPVLFVTGGAVYAGNTCGSGTDAVNTSIDLGCQGVGNPITDLTFAIIRLLAAGVGIVVVASVIVAGIQYTVSRDNPDSTAKARNRIQTTVIALFIYIFSYAILNFLIPGGFFK